eukprot:7234694-Pyramimonas_sp.AAC.1
MRPGRPGHSRRGTFSTHQNRRIRMRRLAVSLSMWVRSVFSGAVAVAPFWRSSSGSDCANGSGSG